MNVAFDRWIPVVGTDGKPDLASLCSVFTDGGKYADLAVRPHERVALMRLFLCVSHAALDGPKNYDEWEKVPHLLPVAAHNYLKTWKDSFELFHETKPWLQVAGLTKSANGKVSESVSADWTPVSKLNFAFATGSNPTLFDHEGAVSSTRDIPLTATIVSMVAFQCFSVGGLIGQVFWNGKRCGELADQKKENGPVKSSDGPCVPASMIHAILRGANLLETIHLNMPTHDDVRFSYADRNVGRPVWEMMPSSMTDTARVENATMTYVGRLVPLTRVIRLHPSDGKILIGDGFGYPSFAAGFPQEPTATVITRQNERALLSYSPAKALWRELSAVVVKRKAGEPSGPLSLTAIQEGEEFDLIVAALARDKATIVDTIEAVYHIPARLRTPVGTASYEEEVKISEGMASRLGRAVEAYRRGIDGGWEGRLKAAGKDKGALKAKLRSTATNFYWTTVEKNLSLLMTHIEAIGTDAGEPTREAWRKMLFKAALEAYSIACGQETARQIRAFTIGWQGLTSTKNDSESNSQETKEEKV